MDATITSAATGGPAGPGRAAAAANGGFGFAYQASDALEITARYDAQTRSRFHNQTASLKALWKF